MNIQTSTQEFNLKSCSGNSDSAKYYPLGVMRLVFFFSFAVYSIIKYLFLGLFSADRSISGSVWIHEFSIALTGMLGIKTVVTGNIPLDGSIIVCNHRSYIDIAAIGKHTRCQFLAKQEVRSWPVLGFGAGIMGVLFVSREGRESRTRAMMDIADFVSSGGSIVVFPEGTTTSGPGILPFKTGSFRIAASADIPVVPVSIRYSDIEDAWVGDDTFIPHFIRVFSKKKIYAHISFGPALSGDDSDELRIAAEEWIRSSLAGS